MIQEIARFATLRGFVNYDVYFNFIGKGTFFSIFHININKGRKVAKRVKNGARLKG
jgi:hypothetical protein